MAHGACEERLLNGAYNFEASAYYLENQHVFCEALGLSRHCHRAEALGYQNEARLRGLIKPPDTLWALAFVA